MKSILVSLQDRLVKCASIVIYYDFMRSEIRLEFSETKLNNVLVYIMEFLHLLHGNIVILQLITIGA